MPKSTIRRLARLPEDFHFLLFASSSVCPCTPGNEGFHFRIPPARARARRSIEADCGKQFPSDPSSSRVRLCVRVNAQPFGLSPNCGMNSQAMLPSPRAD